MQYDFYDDLNGCYDDDSGYSRMSELQQLFYDRQHSVYRNWQEKGMYNFLEFNQDVTDFSNEVTEKPHITREELEILVEKYNFEQEFRCYPKLWDYFLEYTRHSTFMISDDD